MLNYETLLSSYDDKLTLMQWLKKVEEALKDASATSFDVIKTGDATLKFAITFEDGTSLVSGEIVLQQGESVASGEIRNGHLFLTLTNGQELDCGLLFNGEIPSMQVRALEVTGGLIVGNDANAAIGGDLVVHGLTEVQNLLAYGHVETETLTATGDKIDAEKPVIEVMTGYSANIPTIANVEFENIYTGIVKNGNKLTIVHFTKITKRAGAASEHSILGISIPSSIGNKLFPYLIGSYSILDNRNLTAFSNINASVTIPAYIAKVSDSLIYIGIRNTLLVEDTTYFLRYEATFLLSENLIS